MVLIGVISDTHVPARAKGVPPRVLELFEGADLILHAGDFVDESVLRQLDAIAPTKGVLGNCDSAELGAVLPHTASINSGGVQIGMIHDSGPTDRRRERMLKAFPDHRVVVFGHSHRPVIDDDGSLMLLNPGSACDPRWARVPTVAMLRIEEGRPQASLVQI
jgi:putative phosphoesterase